MSSAETIARLDPAAMSEDEQAETRRAIVAEARSWLRTPYHHEGRVKGVGVDCAMLLAEVYHAVGLIPAIDPRPYPRDWHLHRDVERYLGWVQRFAAPTAVAKPGDVALFRYGRCVSHGAIVVDWPLAIHAYVHDGCTLSDVSRGILAGRGSDGKQRLFGFFSFWRS